MQTLSQFIRYGIVGLANATLDFTIVNILSISFGVYSGAPIIAINTVSAAAVITQSYTLNRRWTFGGVAGGGFTLARFIAVNFGAFVLNTSVVYGLTTFVTPPFGAGPLLWENVAKAMAIAVAVMWNFSGFKFFVFRASSADTSHPAPPNNAALSSPAADRMSRRVWLGRIALVLLAVVVGLLHILPSIFIKSAVEREGKSYLLATLAHPLHREVAVWYMPLAREVADGHVPPSDLYVPENKSLPYLQMPLPSLMFGGLIRLAGDPNRAYLWSLFFFPAIFVGLFYWLGRTFALGRLSALAFSLIGTLTPIAIWHRPLAQLAPSVVVKSFIPYIRTPIPELFLTRFNEPMLTLPFFIIAFALIYRFWQRPSTGRGIVAGLAAGLLGYTYIHYAAFTAIFLAVLFIAAMATGRRELRGWIALGATAALVVLPAALDQLALRELAGGRDLLTRWQVAIERGHGIRFSVWRDYLLYAVLAIPLFLLRRREPLAFWFFAALLSSLVLVWNMQLATGFNLMPDHWWKTFGLPLFTLVGVLAWHLSRLAIEKSRGRVSSRLIAALLVIAMGLLVAKRTMNALAYVHSDAATRQAFSLPREVVDSWRWLDQHASPESVVVSDSFVTSLYLTSYTALNPYLPFSELTLATRREVEDRFLMSAKLFGVPPATLERVLRGKHYGESPCPYPCANENTAANFLRVPEMLYGETFNPAAEGFDMLRRDFDHPIPLPVIQDLLARYRAIKPRWQDLGARYVYVGPWEREFSPADFAREPSLALVYENPLVTIYAIK